MSDERTKEQREIDRQLAEGYAGQADAMFAEIEDLLDCQAFSVPSPGLRVRDVHCSDEELIVSVADGRRLAVPLRWFPRLLHATPQQRSHWQVTGGGYGIHWPEIDEDLSTEGLFAGAPSPDFRASQT